MEHVLKYVNQRIEQWEKEKDIDKYYVIIELKAIKRLIELEDKLNELMKGFLKNGRTMDSTRKSSTRIF